LKSPLFEHGGNVFAVACRLGVAPDEIADFSASINPLGLSPLVKKSIIDAVDSLVHYPDICHKELKDALARYHGISPENIFVANGATEIIYHLPALLSGKRALIVSPSFSEYEHALLLHQWEVHHFILSPQTDFTLDMETLEHTLAEGYDVLYLCNPGNPSGTLYPIDIIEEVCTICMAKNVFLVLDEAFMDFSERDSAMQLICKVKNGVLLRSMTKFFSIPGLRLGYAVTSPTLADRLDNIGGPWNVNTLALVAGVTALNDVDHNMKTVAYIRSERIIFSERLSRFPLLKVYPSSTNFLLIEIAGGLTARELKTCLEPQRVLIRDCSSFLGLTPHFFRVALRTEKENDLLIACLENFFVHGNLE